MIQHDSSAVLKNLMLYLKTKSLTFETLFKRVTKEVDDMFMAPESDKQTLRSMLDLVILLSEQVHTSHHQAESTISDFKNYITALEGSYKSVDGDFEKTVAKPAEQEAEEKDREEERAKALEEYSKRARPRFYE